MRLILTGATGMIGAAIARLAVAKGWETLCIVHKGSKRLSRLPDSPLVTVIPSDLDDYASLHLEGTYDVLIHLAWDKTFGGGRDDVDAQLKNVQYTLDAVRLAKRSGCQAFIGAGSQAEYGPKEEKLTPHTSVNPESGYGIAKLTAGLMARLLCKQLGLRCVWTRILSVYGPGDGKQTFISYLITALKNGIAPELTPCQQIWDYCYCDDVANAFLAIAENGKDGMCYPIGSGQGRPLAAYAQDIHSIVNPSIPLRFGARSYYPHQPMYLVADIGDLTKDTGWKPAVGFEEGIRRIMEGAECELKI
jgi:nucleoside-diphosphate-sugar epimerase